MHTGGRIKYLGQWWDRVTRDCQCSTCVDVRLACDEAELAELPYDNEPQCAHCGSPLPYSGSSCDNCAYLAAHEYEG